MAKMVGEGVSRREFFSATAAAGAAAFLTGGFRGLGAVLPTAGAAAEDPDAGRPWFDASFLELQHLMASGQLSSVELTQHYLARIERINPVIHAVLQTNPDALQIARQLD